MKSIISIQQTWHQRRLRCWYEPISRSACQQRRQAKLCLKIWYRLSPPPKNAFIQTHAQIPGQAPDGSHSWTEKFVWLLLLFWLSYKLLIPLSRYLTHIETTCSLDLSEKPVPLDLFFHILLASEAHGLLYCIFIISCLNKFSLISVWYSLGEKYSMLLRQARGCIVSSTELPIHL